MELTYSISTGSRESQQGERTVSSYITILHIDGLQQVVPERTTLSVKFSFERLDPIIVAAILKS